MEKREWGRVEPVKKEASLDLLVLEPRKRIPSHYHTKTLEVHIILNGKDEGKIFVWKPGQIHSYENNSDEEIRILCLCIPPFDPDDKIEVEK